MASNKNTKYNRTPVSNLLNKISSFRKDLKMKVKNKKTLKNETVTNFLKWGCDRLSSSLKIVFSLSQPQSRSN